MLKLILEILEMRHFHESFNIYRFPFHLHTPDEIYLALVAGRVEKKKESILIGIQ